MRLGYFGSPEISANLLRAIVDSGEHEVACVISNPDRPVGRSRRPRPTAVSQLADERGLPLHRFERLKTPDVRGMLESAGCEVFVVFAYGRLLPASLIDLPPLGTVNLHASLLPELRGAAPIQTAILRGYQRTGWSLQKMVLELDAGDVLAEVPLEIRPEETAGELTARMLPQGIDLTLETLRDLPRALDGRRPQTESAATFCSKITVPMSEIDWNQPAVRIHNLIRAMHPWPVARTWLRGGLFRIHRARPWVEAGNGLPQAGPGQLLTVKQDGRRLLVGTQTAPLELLLVQPENRKQLSAEAFLNGFQLKSEDTFRARPDA